MKENIYILSITIGLMSCNNQPNPVGNITISKTNTTTNKSALITNDTLQGERKLDTNILCLQQGSNNETTEINELQDSVIYFHDNLFKDLDSELKEISDSKYKNYNSTNRTTCELDKNGFVNGKGLILDHYCKDICETYLIDKKEKIKLVLPSGYDQGIFGLIMSPSCNQFIVYSSFDGPDYTNYYRHRAEVFGFNMAPGQGIQIIKPTFKVYVKDWSIQEVIWMSDNEIAFKTYEEARSIANKDKIRYKYFKTKVIE